MRDDDVPSDVRDDVPDDVRRDVPDDIPRDTHQDDGLDGEPPRPSVWQRFRQWLLGPPKTESPGRYTPRSPVSTFTSPSKGDAYDFTVRIRWVWVGGRWNDVSLPLSVDPVKAEVWEQIAVATRCILRCFPPHQSAEAEEKLNQRLDEIMRTGQIPASKARWTARAEVTPHETIREEQQAAWSRRLRWAADHEMAEIIVDDFAAMTDKWRALLDKVGIRTADPEPAAFLGRYLVRLASDPRGAADVVDRLSDERERKDRELLDTVAQAIIGHDNLNLLESDLSYDSALRRLMAWAGVPMPEITDRPLDDQDLP